MTFQEFIVLSCALPVILSTCVFPLIMGIVVGFLVTSIPMWIDHYTIWRYYKNKRKREYKQWLDTNHP